MCVCFGVCFACSQAIPYFSEVSVLFAIYEELPRYFIAQKAIKQKAVLSCLSAKGEFFLSLYPLNTVKVDILLQPELEIKLH